LERSSASRCSFSSSGKHVLKYSSFLRSFPDRTSGGVSFCGVERAGSEGGIAGGRTGAEYEGPDTGSGYSEVGATPRSLLFV
jgi:hypothetical protein